MPSPKTTLCGAKPGLLPCHQNECPLFCSLSCVDTVEAAGLLSPTVLPSSEKLKLCGGEDSSRCLSLSSRLVDAIGQPVCLPLVLRTTQLRDLSAAPPSSIAHKNSKKMSRKFRRIC